MTVCCSLECLVLKTLYCEINRCYNDLTLRRLAKKLSHRQKEDCSIGNGWEEDVDQSNCTR